MIIKLKKKTGVELLQFMHKSFPETYTFILWYFPQKYVNEIKKYQSISCCIVLLLMLLVLCCIVLLLMLLVLFLLE